MPTLPYVRKAERAPMRRWLTRQALVLGACLVLLGVGNLPARAQTVSPLTIQPGTNRVGVNTTTPGYTLDVNGTVNATAFYSSGRVGIGTTTPGAKLDIRDNASALLMWGESAQLYGTLTGDSFGTHILAATGRKLTLGANGTTSRLTVSTNGRVGIGTLTPVRELQVVGTARADAFAAGSDEQIYMAPSGLYLDGGYNTYITSTGVGSNKDILFITGSTEHMRITAGGNTYVSGTFYATQKNFLIPHPTKPGISLTHSALEGPEVAVYYRGTAQLEKGEAVITLPDYFEALTRKEGRTVQLTAVKGWSPLYVVDEIGAGKFIVRTAQGGTPDQRFHWEVKAVRADVAPLTMEHVKP